MATCVSKLSESELANLVPNWKDVICPICLDFPNNGILLQCTPYGSGCRTFICNKCYIAPNIALYMDDRENHHINSKDKHVFHPAEVRDMTHDTKEEDGISAFLSFCHPASPAFVTTCCNMCQQDIEAGQGWRCEICPDYDVCNSCFQKDGGVDHPHKLTNHPSTADQQNARNTEARQNRVLQMLEVLVHASRCRYPHCQYPDCYKIKELFHHGKQCQTRSSGGCVLCKKMWYLLLLHGRECKESKCHVPRCRDLVLKEHSVRLQQQADSRRREAVMEKMRQRAAQVVGNNG